MTACLRFKFLMSYRASINSISLLESYDLFQRYCMEFSSFSLTLSLFRYFSACCASLMASQFLVPPFSTTQSWFLGSVLKVISPQQQVHLKQNLKTLMPRQVSSLQISMRMLNLVPMYRQLAQMLQRSDIGNMLRTIISLSLPLPRFTIRSWSKFLGKYFMSTFRSAIFYRLIIDSFKFAHYQSENYNCGQQLWKLLEGVVQQGIFGGRLIKLKIQLPMASKGGITITQDELIKMKMRANLIPNSDAEQNRAAYLFQESQKRTDQWADNLKDLKKRKEEERYKKFEKEELERRRIDEEERKFQQKIKEEQLAKANAKLFQDTEKVRALNSKLLYSDTLQGREQQIEIKNYIKEIEKKREEIYHQETINQIKKGEQEEQKRKEQQKKKLKEFEKNLRKQHKEVKKQYINKYKEEMEEGHLLKLKAEEAIREEEEKERERRERNMQNRKEINEINDKNKQLKALELQKEKEEQAKIEEYRKKQEMVQDITKKRQQDLINEKIKQREALYEQQTFKMSQIKNNDIERLNNQIEELQKKQAEIERKKAEEKRLLKQQYEQSLKDQVERRRREKQQEIEDNHKFKETWKQKLSTLKEKESNEERFRKNMNQKNADELKRQMQEKQHKREEKFLRELAQAQEAKANIQNQDKQFKSYAEKCLKEWQANGKNLYPIIKHLSATMKEA